MLPERPEPLAGHLGRVDKPRFGDGVYWRKPGGTNWPHNTGLVMTSMGACESSTCDKFNGPTAKWFKIDQIGKKSDGNTWYQQDHAKTRHTVNGKPASLTLPDPSSFRRQLVRHEIITLHLAVTLGRVEFYLSYMQICIGDSQTGTPNQTVSLPGAYNNNNPSIYDPSAHSPERHTLSPVDPYRPRNWPAVRERLVDLSASPGGNSSPLYTAKNGKPTSTNGASTGSGSQPAGIAQSSLNRICKLRKHNAPTWASSSISVTYALSFMHGIRDAFHHP